MNPRTANGQASVELIAFLPLVVLIALTVFAFLAAHAAGEEAGAAAEAGALALLQGGSAESAARAALPAHAHAVIDIHGTTVHVKVRPRLPIPALASRLTGEATAATGPR